MMDDLGLSADIVGASSIFTGDEEVFAFARAVVRPHSLSFSPLRRLFGADVGLLKPFGSAAPA